MSTLCSNCEKPLNADGSCPVCLLRLAMNHTDDSLYPVAGKGSQYPTQFGDLPSIEELNQRLPQFEVQRLIGRGGMGGIYQARQRNLDRDVAIKLITPQISKDPAFLERFDREAKALAKLSHPGIVGIFDCGQTTDGLAYLVMEFVDGINLRQAMQLQQITAREAIELTIQICDALEYAHSKGIVHRDIKPENILLGEDGTIKVADFGIAKLTDPDVRTPTLTATRQVLGSLHYLAPEHIETPTNIDHRVDLYAVGVVLYELLTGHLPIGRYEPPSSVVPALGRKIDDVVQQALSRRPQDRYASAEAMRCALVEVQSSEVIELELISPLQPASDSNAVQRVAVPFICEALNGFAETLGVIYFDAEAITAEFRTRDKFFHSSFSGKTKTVRIPRAQLVKLRLSPGVFHTGLTIIADSITTLGDLPNAEAGQVKLRIKNSDLAEAQAGLRLLGYNERSDSTVFHIDQADNPFTASEQVLYGILNFVCAFLNLGYLAIAIVMITDRMSGGERAVAIVAVSIVTGIAAALQTVTGAFHWLGFSRGLANANNVVSVLPLTPVWFFSAPLSIWAWSRMVPRSSAAQLGSTTTVQGLAPKVSHSRGATTLMLLRESRWARAIGWFHAAGSLVIMAGVVVYLLGLYPVVLRYRLLSASPKSAVFGIGPTDPQIELATANPPVEPKHVLAIRQRLSGLDVAVQQDYADELKIRCWQRSSELIEASLRIHGPLQIGWLAVASDSLEPLQALPTLLTDKTSSQLITNQGLLPMMSVHSLQALQSDWVSELQPGKLIAANKAESEATHSIVFQLSNSGRQWLLDQSERKPVTSSAGASAVSDASPSRMLLIADGMIIAQADLQAIRPDRITFDVAAEYAESTTALRAALRGPILEASIEPSN